MNPKFRQEIMGFLKTERTQNEMHAFFEGALAAAEAFTNNTLSDKLCNWIGSHDIIKGEIVKRKPEQEEKE